MNEKVKAILKRYDQWKSLYPPEYIKRFFHIYDDELEPLLDYLRETETATREGHFTGSTAGRINKR